MSVSLLLIPAALAGLPAVLSAGSDAWQQAAGRAREVRVQTRMKDVGLLQAAAEDIGGTVRAADPHRLQVDWPAVQAVFSRAEDGIWSAHFDGLQLNGDAAADLLQRLDAAYARRVQLTLVQRLKDRAEGAGLRLQSETVEEDETVTLVLDVRS